MRTTLWRLGLVLALVAVIAAGCREQQQPVTQAPPERLPETATPPAEVAAPAAPAPAPTPAPAAAAPAPTPVEAPKPAPAPQPAPAAAAPQPEKKKGFFARLFGW